MIVPIPFIPRVRVINKTIVYSDTVLPLKESGANLNVSSINGVSESELENCLRVIFNNNKDVVFNTIQYSRSDKKVYFYTDKVINTKVYEDSKKQVFKPVHSRTEILEEVKSILVTEKSTDPELISLYDVAVLLKVMHAEYDKAKSAAEEQVKLGAKYYFGDGASIYFTTFNYKNKTLTAHFKKFRSSDYEEVVFSKNDGDLYIVSSNSPYNREILRDLGVYLSDLYDVLLRFENYRDDNEAKYHVDAVNTSFEASISHYGAGIYEYDNGNQKFKLFSPSYDNEFHIECNSSMLTEAFKDNEDELFKRVYVPIAECPSWCQDALRERRKKQLVEEDKEALEEMMRENRRKRREELKEKFFPFLKKRN